MAGKKPIYESNAMSSIEGHNDGTWLWSIVETLGGREREKREDMKMGSLHLG